MTFLAAGHETTASALTWAILLLCQHPEIQTRLRKDLQDAGLPDVRDPSSNVTTELLDRIPYLEAVCSEVLRFIPPVALTCASFKNFLFIVDCRLELVLAP